MKIHGRDGRRLFRRVYLHGVLLLVVVGVSVVLVGWLTGRGTFRDHPLRLSRYVAAGQVPLLGDPDALQRELDRLDEDVGLQVSTYDARGRLLATTLRPPAPPLPPGEIERLAHGPLRLGRGHIVAPLREASGVVVGYTIGVQSWPGPNVTRIVAVILAIVGALTIASWPLARSIARPVEGLTRAVRAFGAGDLSARTGLRREDELGELAASFDEMAERVERLVRSEKELLANVSHELRTPMARIRVALELAAEGDGERARAYLQEIGTDLAELERLVEDVMAAARLDLARGRAGDGAPPLRKAPVELAPLLERAAERFRGDHPRRELQTELPEDLGSLDADPDLLRRAVMNLLDNARKYSDGAIRLAARREDGEVVIEVSDRGIGIAPEDLERIFTPFFRTDRSRARGTGGVGLGLALVRRIAEAHGGRAIARSEPGKGTSVEVRVRG